MGREDRSTGAKMIGGGVVEDLEIVGTLGRKKGFGKGGRMPWHWDFLFLLVGGEIARRPAERRAYLGLYSTPQVEPIYPTVCAEAGVFAL